MCQWLTRPRSTARVQEQSVMAQSPARFLQLSVFYLFGSYSTNEYCNFCQGTLIDFGTLRYGQTILGEYGETVEWRHWYGYALRSNR